MDSLLAVLPWTALSGLIVGGIALYGQLKISRRTIAAQKESQREIIASQQALAGTARRHTLLDKRADAHIDYIRELQTFPYLPDIDPTQESMKHVAEYMERLEEWLDAWMDNVAPLYAYASQAVAPKVLEDQRLNENGIMWIRSRLNAILNFEVVESEPQLILTPHDLSTLRTIRAEVREEKDSGLGAIHRIDRALKRGFD